MRAVEERLCADFCIGHTTIQVENVTPLQRRLVQSQCRGLEQAPSA